MCIDQSYVFNTVCHMLALAEEGKITDAACNLVLTVLAVESQRPPENIGSLANLISEAFGFGLAKSLIQATVDRLQTERSVRWIGGRLTIDEEKKQTIEALIRSARELEARVRQEWIDEIAAHPEYQPNWETELWSSLVMYLGNVLRRYGIRARQMLDPNSQVDVGSASKTLETMFAEAYESCITQVSREFVSMAITAFFTNTTTAQSDYLSELLDGAFTYFALATDNSVAGYMARQIAPVSVFVDTNVVFGIVGLQSHPLNAVVQEIVTVVREHDLPFTFLIHEKTLLEYRSALEYYGQRIKEGHPWKPAVSRAAITNGHTSSIERRFHELNASAPLDPDVFLARYRAPEALLRTIGFVLHTPSGEPTEAEIAERANLRELYRVHLETRFPGRRPKPQESLEHDAMLLQAARKNRKPESRVLEAGSMCLSIDSTLYSFDWYDQYTENPFGVVVFPHQLLHLLRPFAPVTKNFKKHFVETFALPIFRVIGVDFSDVKHRVLNYLNAFADVPEDTAIRILTDNYLLRRLQDTPEGDDHEFEDLIERAIAKDNVRLQTENRMLYEQLQGLQEEVRQLHEAIERSTRASKKYERDVLLSRILTGLSTSLLLLFSLFVLPVTLKWDWLNNHSQRLSILVAATISVFGIAWTIIDSNKERRKFALGSIILPALFIIVKILGP